MALTTIDVDDLAKLRDILEGERNAVNRAKRAEIALASAQQDRVEYLQHLQEKYVLRETDAIDAVTGAITRKG